MTSFSVARTRKPRGEELSLKTFHLQQIAFQKERGKKTSGTFTSHCAAGASRLGPSAAGPHFGSCSRCGKAGPWLPGSGPAPLDARTRGVLLCGLWTPRMWQATLSRGRGTPSPPNHGSRRPLPRVPPRAEGCPGEAHLFL